MNGQRDELEYDYGSTLAENWKDAFSEENVQKFDEQGLPILGEYVFGETGSVL